MDTGKTFFEIPIPRFGSVTGLIFEDGGYVEILMTFPELDKLLLAWMDYEEGKPEPDGELMAALKTVLNKADSFDATIRAEVPIAKWKAKITPVIRGSEPEARPI